MIDVDVDDPVERAEVWNDLKARRRVVALVDLAAITPETLNAFLLRDSPRRPRTQGGKRTHA